MDINELEAFVKVQLGEEENPLSEKILEKVWHFYTFDHPIDNEITHNKLMDLETLLQNLSQKRKRRVVREVLDLCVEHEREAYISGIRLGAKLMLEILNMDYEKKT